MGDAVVSEFRAQKGLGTREVRVNIREAPGAAQNACNPTWAVPGESGSGKAVGREHLRGEAVTKIEEGQELRRGQVA